MRVAPLNIKRPGIFPAFFVKKLAATAAATTAIAVTTFVCQYFQVEHGVHLLSFS
jgi:hypothetical protein